MFKSFYILLLILLVPVQIGRIYLLHNRPLMKIHYDTMTKDMNFYERYVYDVKLLNYFLRPKIFSAFDRGYNFIIDKIHP